MNKYLSFFTVMSVLMSMTSCVKSYSIDGSSDISGLDSRMMYLKTVKNNELKDLDSTEVVHGKFGFTGTTDSVRMAYLVVSEAYTLPLVLEDGDINVRINKARTEWGGTPLNDRLYRFMKSLDSLNLQLQDLEHEYNIAFMDGEDMNEVIPRLSRANQLINMSIDTLVTQSIADNFDNNRDTAAALSRDESLGGGDHEQGHRRVQERPLRETIPGQRQVYPERAERT